MSFDISIQPRDKSQKVARASVDSFLSSLPGVHRETVPGESRDESGIFSYGHPAGRLFLNIYMEGEKEVDAVCLSVPAAYSGKASAAITLLIGFRIAEQLGWQVYDPQVGEYYGKDTFEDVLKSQHKFGVTVDDILRRRAIGNTTFPQRFVFHLYRPAQSRILATIFLSAIIAGFLVYYFMLSESAFVWLAMGVALVILVVSALIQSLLFVSHSK